MMANVFKARTQYRLKRANFARILVYASICLTIVLFAFEGLITASRDFLQIDSNVLSFFALQFILSICVFAVSLYVRYGLGIKRFTPQTNKTIARDLYLLLHGDRSKGQIFVVFQPKFHFNESTYKSAEVLARWDHPRYGTIQPDRFISLAEDLNLIDALTLEIIKQASHLLTNDHLRDIKFRVAINISGKSISNPEFMDSLVATVKKSGARASQFMLEITETATIQDISNSRNRLLELKHLGFKISMDDFGTGVASVALLHQLPMDEIKIDRRFISNITEDSTSKAIVFGLLSMAKHLNLAVVAEGVEHAEENKFIREAGVDIAQGFFFSQPVNAEEIKKILYPQAMRQTLKVIK